MARTRAFTFTINNYTDEDEDFVGALFYDYKASYVIAGKEVCPTTGTPHLQGYLRFDNARNWDYVVGLHPHWHLEIAQGDANQNFVYCSKDKDFVEFGTRPLTHKEAGEKGAQERWELAKTGQFEQLPPEQIKTYEYIYQKFHPVEDRNVLDNIWIYGPSGCGKSSYVRNQYPVFYTKGMHKWWDNYQHEDVVLLDDFDPNHGSYLSYYLKIWADHYAFNAEVKGGMLRARPKTVIVTSQYTIEQCFRMRDGTPDDPTIAAINRRFKKLNWSGFFGQFINPDWNGGPIRAIAPNFVPPPEEATVIPEDLNEDEIIELLGMDDL